MCAGALLESHLLGIGRPIWTQSQSKLPLGARGAPNGPTEPQGSQREAKVTSGRAPWEPEAPQRVPKGSPKSPEGEQNKFQRHPKETKKSENYIHINKIHTNSRSTAIQRPTSIYIYILIYIYSNIYVIYIWYIFAIFLRYFILCARMRNGFRRMHLMHMDA